MGSSHLSCHLLHRPEPHEHRFSRVSDGPFTPITKCGVGVLPVHVGNASVGVRAYVQVRAVSAEAIRSLFNPIRRPDRSRRPVRRRTAQAQSPSEKDGGIAAYKAKYLNGSVYRIRILHNFYYWDKPTELYTATAVLVRAPNLLLTTRLVDSGNVGVYETYEKVAEYDEKRGRFTVDVCQEEPDRVRVETEKRATKDLQDKDKEKIEKNDKDIYYRYSSENAKEDADKKFKGNQKAQKDEQKQKVDKNYEPASTQDVLTPTAHISRSKKSTSAAVSFCSKQVILSSAASQSSIRIIRILGPK